MLQDLRFAVRSFRRQSVLTLVALVSLALAVGANTAIFSVVNAIFLRPLPFRDPASLVLVWDRNPILGGALSERLPTSLTNYEQWKRDARSFESLAAMEHLSLDLTGGGTPERVQVARSTADFLPLLGVSPHLGRLYQPSDGSADVALLSHAIWTRRFGADPSITGKTITLGGLLYTVIGVLPPAFHLPAFAGGFDWKRPEIWLPLNEQATDSRARFDRRLFVFARLRPDVLLERARSEMNVISRRLEKAFPDQNTGFSVNVFPIALEDVGETGARAVLALQVAVGLVLLIACANVANLLLTRAIARSQEIAVRIASGATPTRLFGQTLVESLLLSLTGGLAGIPVALALIRIIGAFAPEESYHLRELTLDPAVLSFTLAAAVLSGLIFGTTPASYIARARINELLAAGGRSGASSLSHKARRTFVIVEVALAQLLLIGAGLMIRSVYSVLSVDTGFRADHVLTFHLQLPDYRYKTGGQLRSFADQLIGNLSRLPGAASVAVASALPILDNIQASSFEIEGVPPADPRKPPIADMKPVSEAYFETLGIRVLEGRGFSLADTQRDGTVAVNQAFARQFFPNQSAIGKTILAGAGASRKQIIAVVAGTPQFGLETSVRPEIFLPTREIRGMTVMIRTAVEPASLANAATAAVNAIDPDLPASDVRPLSQHLINTQSARRFQMLLFGGFAALALLLSAASIYGVLSFLVTRRVREIGVRMALGAEARDILRLVLGQGLGMAATGVLVGTAAAFALTRLIESLLFGVRPTDPVTFLAVGILLAAVALLAGLVPARRAASVDPVICLRAE